MGQLTEGTPLPWPRVRELSNHVREQGIKQFLNAWKKGKDRTGDDCTWGDELENMVVKFDDEKKLALLALNQDETIKLLRESGTSGGALTNGGADSICRPPPEIDPEYADYMIESSPGRAYSSSLSSLLEVEPDLSHRRSLVRAHLPATCSFLSISSFPRLGATGRWLDPQHQPGGPVLKSLFVPDEIISPHPRMVAMSVDIEQRRGRKICVNVPVFRDERTPWPWKDPDVPWDRELYPSDLDAKNGAAKPNHIYMDALAFGAGCCCVQQTIQLPSLAAARRIYDALLPLAPVMLALSAAAPAYRGWLADVDARWDVIRDAADDRTEEEMGLKPLKDGYQLLAKSRYDSSSCYLSSDAANKPEYSDIPLPVNEGAYDTLQKGGVDEPLAKHVAHLFVRDALLLLEEQVEQPEDSLGHFDNILSTNWQTLRLKPSSPDGSTGWRVEFRACEAQLTDKENAAMCVFVILLCRALLYFNGDASELGADGTGEKEGRVGKGGEGLGVNMYVPISRVDEGMREAVKRDAVRQAKFWWRKGVRAPAEREEGNATAWREDGTGVGSVYDECELLTVDEIINGKDDASPGLLSLIRLYLARINAPSSLVEQLEPYLSIISRRASGELPTNARWMREFITSHPAYEKDSRVGEEVCWALMRAIEELERGQDDGAGRED